MSGTSADAVDAALVRFDPFPEVLAARSTPLPPELRSQLRGISGQTPLLTLAQLDVQLGRLSAAAVLDLLAAAQHPADAVSAIGSHGQTVWHAPDGEFPFTMQIGDPNVIVELTGICTVADFRRRDVAAGGQGAPLVPAFHKEVFGSTAETRCILNLGGIANITILRGDAVTGFDTGPANTLLDSWISRHRGVPYDAGGAWAATGSCRPNLLNSLLSDPYFERHAPKSTGPEHFSLSWLEEKLAAAQLKPQPQDVQATLLELTARTVADAIRRDAPDAGTVLVCGGGVHNGALMARLSELLAPARVASTREAGVDPDFVEACAFAWLARQRLAGRPGNLPAVTGAHAPVVLGGIYSGSR
jgi:anhydro-N-acetylmuramic acid kinase